MPLLLVLSLKYILKKKQNKTQQWPLASQSDHVVTLPLVLFYNYLSFLTMYFFIIFKNCQGAWVVSRVTVYLAQVMIDPEVLKLSPESCFLLSRQSASPSTCSLPPLLMLVLSRINSFFKKSFNRSYLGREIMGHFYLFKLLNRDTWVAQRLSVCLWLRA